MAIDTYGFKAPRFRKFLNHLADHGASRTVPAGDTASDAAAEATLSAIARSKSYWKRRIMGQISVALVSDIGNRVAGAPISYALRTARDSENSVVGFSCAKIGWKIGSPQPILPYDFRPDFATKPRFEIRV